MNILVLNTLDEYIRTSSLSDAQDIRSFLRLFKDPDSPCVYNDLIGTPGYQEQITPKVYSRLVDQEKGSVLRTEISKVRKEGDYYQEGGNWHRRIAVNKYVMSIDASVYVSEAGGVLFDSDKLYPEHPDFSLILDMEYDPEEDRMLIAGIRSRDRMPSLPLDSGKFTVIVRPDNEYADYLYSNDRKVEFNDFNQALVDEESLSVNDDDVVLSYKTIASSDLYDVKIPVFKKYHVRLKPRFGMTAGDAFHFTFEPSGVSFESSSGAKEAGLDFGFSLAKMNRRSRLLLYLGAGMSWSDVDMSAGSFSYRYGSAVPVSYEISEVTEAYAYQDYVFPVYFELENSLGSRFSLSFDVGAKFYLNRSSEVVSPFHVEGAFSRVGGASGSFSENFESFIAPASYGKNPYDLSVFAGVNLEVRLVSSLYLFASGGFEYGGIGLPAFNSSNEPFCMSGSGASSASILPVVYAGGKHLAYHSFVNCVSFNRQAVWVSGGLKIKL